MWGRARSCCLNSLRYISAEPSVYSFTSNLITGYHYVWLTVKRIDLCLTSKNEHALQWSKLEWTLAVTSALKTKWQQGDLLEFHRPVWYLSPSITHLCVLTRLVLASWQASQGLLRGGLVEQITLWGIKIIYSRIPEVFDAGLQGFLRCLVLGLWMCLCQDWFEK